MHRGGGRPAAAYARLPLRESEMPQPVLYSLGRVQAEDDEVAVNARARSAVLRGRTQRHAAAGRRRSRLRAYGFLPGSDLAVPRKGGKGGRR